MDGAFLMRQLEQFIYMLASHGHIVFLGTLGITVFGLGPIGRALAARIRGTTSALSDEASLSALKAGLTELQGRLDFSERILNVRQRLIGSGESAPPIPPPRATTPV